MKLKIFKKINAVVKDETIRNGTLFSLFSFINRGFSFFLLLILANIFTPDEYGHLSLFNTVVMLISYFIAMCSDGYLSVSYFRDGKDALKQCFSCVFVTSLIVTITFILLFKLKGAYFFNLLNLPSYSFYLALFICFFTVFGNILSNFYRIQKKVLLCGILSCGTSFLYFLLTIIFVKYMQAGWQGCVLSNLTSRFVFGAVALVFFVKNGLLCIPSRSYWKKMLLWGIPLIPHLATTFIRQGCDRYIINYFYGTNDVGLFSFALNLANIIIMIGLGFNNSNSVEIYEILGNGKINNNQKKDLIRKQRLNVFKIYLCISLTVSIIGSVMLPIIFPKYEASVGYFAILAFYAFFQCLYFLYTNFLFYYKKTVTLMHITFFSAILHLLLSFVLTRYSLYATCLIYCFTHFVVFLIVRNQANKLLRLELPA